MKAIIVVDLNDDTYLEPEADVIIDNGDFHLETKAFLKPLPKKLLNWYADWQLNSKAFVIGYNACLEEIIGEEE